jgi:carbonic anhydrase
MKHWKQVWAATLAAALVACHSSSTHSGGTGHKAEWSYQGHTGPEHWGELDPAFALAKTGQEQSPVDIVRAEVVTGNGAPLEVSYQPTPLTILHNGHTIEEECEGGGSLTVGGHRYELAQFHFHSPSEHTIDGQHTPLELHLVHKDTEGKLAVLGVLIDEGKAHPELARLWEHLPTEPGNKVSDEEVKVDPARLLPTSLATYRYAGSLTTPPCSEGVSWFVLQQPIEASAEQVGAFRKVIHGNNRPTQPLRGRKLSAVR